MHSECMYLEATIGDNDACIAKIKEMTSHCRCIYCSLYRNPPFQKKMSSEIVKRLERAINIIKYKKSRILKNKLFKFKREVIGRKKSLLILYTEVRLCKKERFYVC